jgi:HSP20 family protein
VFLGEGLDPDVIEARYDSGVLTLTIPMAEQVKARRVEIASSNPNAKPIETATKSPSDSTTAASDHMEDNGHW